MSSSIDRTLRLGKKKKQPACQDVRWRGGWRTKNDCSSRCVLILNGCPVEEGRLRKGVHCFHLRERDRQKREDTCKGTKLRGDAS